MPTNDRYGEAPKAVGFDITTLPGSPPSQAWMGSYAAQGKLAKFRIVLSAAKPIPDKELPQYDMASGTGKFISVPEPDATILLADLKKAL